MRNTFVVPQGRKEGNKEIPATHYSYRIGRVHASMTVLRNLDGVTYWVLEDPAEIAELVNVNVRKEWESDNRARGKDPSESNWLRSLESRSWRLETLSMEGIRLSQEIMSIKNEETGYDFGVSLQKRKAELRREIEEFGAIIRPVILRGEDRQLMDGYCRVATLRDMGIPRTYAYVGSRAGGTGARPTV